ncbi:MAG: TlyA family RNA methyltransferase [Pseudomonadota bacterium]
MRADQALVVRGVFRSRSAAQAAIDAGLVSVDGVVIQKASQKVDPNAQIVATPAHPYVSRGGLKLAHALDVFEYDPNGRVCLDLGASTGGFTDVLLRRGAAEVFAIDVGRGQLRAEIAGNSRVSAMEGTDVRRLTEKEVPRSPNLIVCDLSFISLEKALETPLRLASSDATLIALFKPQFQVGRKGVGRGGIVRDKAIAEAAEQVFASWLLGQGWKVAAWADSPILGGDGNAERLVAARREA